MSPCSGPQRAGLCLIAACVLVVTGPDGQTIARFSDFGVTGARASAGVWAPDPPAACGDLSKYGAHPDRRDAVIWGTMGDDVLVADPKGNHRQVIMGLGGNDEIIGGNSGDCLVGGDGDDRLVGGNAKDILLGGPGNDYLDGGNAKDYLDGEDDEDECLGGNGNDEVVNCGPTAASADIDPEMGASEAGSRSPAVAGTVDDPDRDGPEEHPETGVRPDDPPVDETPATPAADDAAGDEATADDAAGEEATGGTDPGEPAPAASSDPVSPAPTGSDEACAAAEPTDCEPSP